MILKIALFFTVLYIQVYKTFIALTRYWRAISIGLELSRFDTQIFELGLGSIKQGSLYKKQN